MQLKQLNLRKLLKRQKQKVLQPVKKLNPGEVNTKVTLSKLQVGILSAIILTIGFIYIVENSNKEIAVQTAVASIATSNATEKKELNNYEAFMFMIKAKESFQAEAYECPAGFLTIGFGYNIEANGWETVKPFMVNNQITYDGATKILIKQVEQVMTSLVTTHKLTHLNTDQKRAVASLILNCGESKIKYRFGKRKLGKSKFWKTLEAGHIPDFTVYSKFKTPSGKVKSSPTLLNARKFEQALFCGDKRTVQRIGELAKRTVIQRDIHAAKKAGVMN